MRPQDIKTTALLTIEGELDDISGAGQTKAAHDLCEGIPKNRAFHYDAEGAGHYGIFSGRRWREKVYPEVRSFIARFDSAAAVKAKPVALPAPKAGSSKPVSKPTTKPAAKATPKKAPVKVPAKKAGKTRG